MHTPGVIWTTLAMSSFSSVLGGEGGQQGREAERYLEVNTENTSSAKVRVQLLLFVQALPGQVIPNSLSAS